MALVGGVWVISATTTDASDQYLYTLWLGSDGCIVIVSVEFLIPTHDLVFLREYSSVES